MLADALQCMNMHCVPHDNLAPVTLVQLFWTGIWLLIKDHNQVKHLDVFLGDGTKPFSDGFVVLLDLLSMMCACCTGKPRDCSASEIFASYVVVCAWFYAPASTYESPRYLLGIR